MTFCAKNDLPWPLPPNTSIRRFLKLRSPMSRRTSAPSAAARPISTPPAVPGERTMAGQALPTVSAYMR